MLGQWMRFTDKPLPAKWILAPIIEADTVTLSTGDSGAGKSIICASITLAVIRGSGWCGFKANPGRVLYIDNEPIALAHSTLLLADTADPERHHAIAADFLRPEDLWDRVSASAVIDVRESIALVLNAVMNFVTDEQNPDRLLDYYRARLAPGSLLVLSQMTNENPVNEDERQALLDLLEYYETTTNPAFMRSMAEFERFFGGWPMLEPGLVYAPAWHPDEHTVFAGSPSESRVIGGIARKP